MPPIELYGTTLLDHVHKGPNQAGNKSLLAYNTVQGIPGYTGYIPGNASLLLPVKGFDHTGRPPSTQAVQQLTIRTVDPRKNTEYVDGFQKLPSDMQRTDRTGGGYWIPQRTMQAPKPFTATSVYRAEVLASGDTAAAQLGRAEGLACTLVGYEAARQAGEMRRSISADPRQRAEATARGIGGQTVLRPGSGGSILDAAAKAQAVAAMEPSSPQAASSVFGNSARRPATVPTSNGELPGYQTTYGSMNHQLSGMQAELELTRGPAPFGPGGDPRFKVLPRVMNPGMTRTYSTYAAEYGGEGHDPMSRTAPDKATMTRLSTTRDMAQGTTRNVSHIPRYTGHIPASAYASDEGRLQGEAAEPRPDHKANSLPYQLDQYPRGRLPGYTGVKPQAPRNVNAALAHTTALPCDATASGDAALRGTMGGMPAPDTTHHVNTRAGLMTFFNASTVGTEFVSDNGLATAEVYFTQAKATGKLGIRTSQPSRLTVYGAPFRAAASMV
ncbi:hypothetical protein TSOC_012133 [Tetrabaena socialis]|uniref:Flagellar associated protein n=1 Tax=Tetrabaena socialis TaxID=47790 RepID=A0A2J7ZNT4_9CHLO|nr:hypothetical protein TSOC_012133 [Tetrabaena socialis]|eukprot:PNH01934.1 hypothetical protein TSOC_012133 [Tetrabaena socialis]